jgi:hypothetical protein
MIEPTIVRISNVAQLHTLFLRLPGYVFRGHTSSEWGLTSSLERSVRKSTNFLTKGLLRNTEHWMLYEFQRRFPIYATSCPSRDSIFDWLAIMQHFGCPTRLLDFSESPYVAAYFSIAMACEDSAIWCIDNNCLSAGAHALLGLGYDPRSTLKDKRNLVHLHYANANLLVDDETESIPAVLSVEPSHPFERAIRQQCVLLHPTVFNGNWSFYDQLMRTLSEGVKLADAEELSDEVVELDSLSGIENAPLIKIILPLDLHYDLRILLQQTNTTAEVLFPGIEGLARSLWEPHQ